jgi:two-component system response regulator YesN
LYKVFLVEDEIVTREGIRDNVDWRSVGFEFCGEAPDGEMALPLIEKAQPDVLITDIKMPFMDGLQLSKIVRERMPWVKIIILSGHDEFDYAQAAVKLGVTEYLLKPASAQDLRNVLQRVAVLLDQEGREKESLQRLREQLADSRALIREKFLLRLAMGAESAPAAVEQSQALGLDIVAKCYLVVLVKIELRPSAQPFDYNQCQQVARLVSNLVENNPDALLTNKDMQELVLIIKGESPEQVQQAGHALAERIKREIEDKTTCGLTIGMGSPQGRLGDIHHSFAEALARAGGTGGEALPMNAGTGDRAELLKLDGPALDSYLKSGMPDDFDGFFDAYIQPLAEAALRSYLVKNYVFVDIVLTTAQFVSDLGGDVDQVFPEVSGVERLLLSVKTLDQMREETRRIFARALAFRDSQVRHQRALIVHQAKAYIDTHFINPDLSLSKVAAHVNLSPSHFSAVFSRETGQTFKEYLTRLRIERAKELLRTTNLKSFEVAYQSGYNDPHYFSYIFRKNTGLSPQQFRSQPQSGKREAEV